MEEEGKKGGGRPRTDRADPPKPFKGEDAELLKTVKEAADSLVSQMSEVPQETSKKTLVEKVNEADKKAIQFLMPEIAKEVFGFVENQHSQITENNVRDFLNKIESPKKKMLILKNIKEIFDRDQKNNKEGYTVWDFTGSMPVEVAPSYSGVLTAFEENLKKEMLTSPVTPESASEMLPASATPEFPDVNVLQPLADKAYLPNYKVSIIGDEGVGKTDLTAHLRSIDSKKVDLNIVDEPAKDAQVVVVVCDATDKNASRKLIDQISGIGVVDAKIKIKVIIVVNKIDQDVNGDVLKKMNGAFGEDGMGYRVVGVSATTGTGIQELFEVMESEALKLKPQSMVAAPLSKPEPSLDVTLTDLGLSEEAEPTPIPFEEDAELSRELDEFFGAVKDIPSKELSHEESEAIDKLMQDLQEEEILLDEEKLKPSVPERPSTASKRATVLSAKKEKPVSDDAAIKALEEILGVEEQQPLEDDDYISNSAPAGTEIEMSNFASLDTWEEWRLSLKSASSVDNIKKIAEGMKEFARAKGQVLPADFNEHLEDKVYLRKLCKEFHGLSEEKSTEDLLNELEIAGKSDPKAVRDVPQGIVDSPESMKQDKKDDDEITAAATAGWAALGGVFGEEAPVSLATVSKKVSPTPTEKLKFYYDHDRVMWHEIQEKAKADSMSENVKFLEACFNLGNPDLEKMSASDIYAKFIALDKNKDSVKINVDAGVRSEIAKAIEDEKGINQKVLRPAVKAIAKLVSQQVAKEVAALTQKREKLPIILSDVDGTLLIGSGNAAFNDTLIDQWISQGVTEIYLFTSHSANSAEGTAISRPRLVEYLKQKGINVLAVVTHNDPDYVNANPGKALGSYYDDHIKGTEEILDKLNKTTNPSQLVALRHELENRRFSAVDALAMARIKNMENLEEKPEAFLEKIALLKQKREVNLQKNEIRIKTFELNNGVQQEKTQADIQALAAQDLMLTEEKKTIDHGLSALGEESTHANKGDMFKHVHRMLDGTAYVFYDDQLKYLENVEEAGKQSTVMPRLKFVSTLEQFSVQFKSIKTPEEFEERWNKVFNLYYAPSEILTNMRALIGIVQNSGKFGIYSIQPWGEKSINPYREMLVEKLKAKREERDQTLEKNLREGKEVPVNLIVAYVADKYLGDERTGNAKAKKQDRANKAELENVLNKLPPEERLEVLEGLFQKIDVNQNNLYTYVNRGGQRFKVDKPLTATQQKHMGILKDLYLSTVRENQDNVEVTEVLRRADHRVVDAETSNSTVFLRGLSPTRTALFNLYGADHLTALSMLFRKEVNPFVSEGNFFEKIMKRMEKGYAKAAPFTIDDIVDFLMYKQESDPVEAANIAKLIFGENNLKRNFREELLKSESLERLVVGADKKLLDVIGALKVSGAEKEIDVRNTEEKISELQGKIKTISVGKKRIAFVDIDGTLIIENKESKKVLNVALVNALRDFDEVHLFTQRGCIVLKDKYKGNVDKTISQVVQELEDAGLTVTSVSTSLEEFYKDGEPGKYFAEVIGPFESTLLKTPSAERHKTEYIEIDNEIELILSNPAKKKEFDALLDRKFGGDIQSNEFSVLLRDDFDLVRDGENREIRKLLSNLEYLVNTLLNKWANVLKNNPEIASTVAGRAVVCALAQDKPQFKGNAIEFFKKFKEVYKGLAPELKDNLIRAGIKEAIFIDPMQDKIGHFVNLAKNIKEKFGENTEIVVFDDVEKNLTEIRDSERVQNKPILIRAVQGEEHKEVPLTTLEYMTEVFEGLKAEEVTPVSQSTKAHAEATLLAPSESVESVPSKSKEQPKKMVYSHELMEEWEKLIEIMEDKNEKIDFSRIPSAVDTVTYLVNDAYRKSEGNGKLPSAEKYAEIFGSLVKNGGAPVQMPAEKVEIYQKLLADMKEPDQKDNLARIMATVLPAATFISAEPPKWKPGKKSTAKAADVLVGKNRKAKKSAPAEVLVGNKKVSLDEYNRAVEQIRASAIARGVREKDIDIRTADILSILEPDAQRTKAAKMTARVETQSKILSATDIDWEKYWATYEREKAKYAGGSNKDIGVYGILNAHKVACGLYKIPFDEKRFTEFYREVSEDRENFSRLVEEYLDERQLSAEKPSVVSVIETRENTEIDWKKYWAEFNDNLDDPQFFDKPEFRINAHIASLQALDLITAKTAMKVKADLRKLDTEIGTNDKVTYQQAFQEKIQVALGLVAEPPVVVKPAPQSINVQGEHIQAAKASVAQEVPVQAAKASVIREVPTRRTIAPVAAALGEIHLSITSNNPPLKVQELNSKLADLNLILNPQNYAATQEGSTIFVQKLNAGKPKPEFVATPKYIEPIGNIDDDKCKAMLLAARKLYGEPIILTGGSAAEKAKLMETAQREGILVTLEARPQQAVMPPWSREFDAIQHETLRTLLRQKAEKFEDPRNLFSVTPDQVKALVAKINETLNSPEGLTARKLPAIFDLQSGRSTPFAGLVEAVMIMPEFEKGKKPLFSAQKLEEQKNPAAQQTAAPVATQVKSDRRSTLR